MSYQLNSTSKKTSIRINNPKISVRGNLVSIREEKEQEELVSDGISENYKNNLILVFVIVITIVIVVTGAVLFTVYS